MKTVIYNSLLKIKADKGGVYAVLIDPDRKSDNTIEKQVAAANESGVDIILVGGSLMMDSRCHDRTKRIKELSEMPVVFFPGGLSQLNSHFDAMLFMSIISGRNPHYLIGEQVLAAPVVHDLGIEAIPTGYMLFDGGAATTVQFMSNTSPIPINRPDIALAHGLAGQYLGLKMLYLEAGSGAHNPIPVATIQKMAGLVEVPFFVGGGIRTPEAARERAEAGATVIVTGTIIEENPEGSLMKEFADAIHTVE